MNMVAQKMEDDGGASFKDGKVTRHVGGTSTQKVKDKAGNEVGEEELSVSIL
jgi:hypothetical protein